jgi:hypothetical protein
MKKYNFEMLSIWLKPIHFCFYQIIHVLKDVAISPDLSTWLTEVRWAGRGERN